MSVCEQRHISGIMECTQDVNLKETTHYVRERTRKP